MDKPEDVMEKIIEAKGILEAIQHRWRCEVAETVAKKPRDLEAAIAANPAAMFYWNGIRTWERKLKELCG